MFAFGLTVVLYVVAGVLRLLGRILWDCAGREDDEGWFRMQSKEYKEFIAAEMARIHKKQPKARSRKQKTGRRESSEGKKSSRKELYEAGDCHTTNARPITVKKEQNLTDAVVESILDWRRHPDLFRPPGTPTAHGSVKKAESSPATVKDSPTREAAKNLRFRNPAVSYKRALTIPAFPPVTPVRRIKLEYTVTPTLASPFSSSSGSSTPHIESGFTPSTTATLPTSSPSCCTKSPTPQPRVPEPGDMVFRRRPAHFILKGTVDETDLWDGPFMVLSTTLQKWVQLLLPEGSKTPAWTAITDIIFSPDRKVQVAKVEFDVNGTKLYAIDKIRGVIGKVHGRRKFFVHWKGWGCEDDTWEPEKGLPKVFIKEFEERVRIWERLKGSGN